jgi:hypothetical protein
MNLQQMHPSLKLHGDPQHGSQELMSNTFPPRSPQSQAAVGRLFGQVGRTNRKSRQLTTPIQVTLEFVTHDCWRLLNDELLNGPSEAAAGGENAEMNEESRGAASNGAATARCGVDARTSPCSS